MTDEMFLPHQAHHFLLMDSSTGSLLGTIVGEKEVIKLLDEARHDEEEDLSSVMVVAVDEAGHDRRTWLALEFLGEAGYPVFAE